MCTQCHSFLIYVYAAKKHTFRIMYIYIWFCICMYAIDSHSFVNVIVGLIFVVIACLMAVASLIILTAANGTFEFIAFVG